MNTKKILTIAAMLLVGVSGFSQNFSIEGKLKNFKKGDKLYLIKRSATDNTTDSIICLKNGRVSYNTDIAEPLNVFLIKVPDGKTLKETPSTFFKEFYAYPENKLTIEGDALNLPDAIISGGIYSNPRYTKFFEEKAVIDGELSGIRIKMDSIKAKDGVNKEFLALNDLAFKTNDKSYELMMKFIEANTSDEFSAFLLTNIRGSIASKNHERLYNLLSENVKNTPSAKSIAKSIAVNTAWKGAKAKLVAGAVAPNFTLTELSGSKISLSDFRGKYVLLDFWGSWCGPCREANKHMVKLYDKYKNKPDFEMISLALDKNDKEWKDAIIKDGLLWKQVNMCEEKDLLKSVNVTYGINLYPTQVLISPEGKVLVVMYGYDEKNDVISKKLEEIYSK